MDNTCKTCRWWDDGHEYAGQLRRPCTHPKVVSIAGGLDSSPRETAPLDGVVCDGEVYGGSFETGANFGCIHYEPLPKGAIRHLDLCEGISASMGPGGLLALCRVIPGDEKK